MLVVTADVVVASTAFTASVVTAASISIVTAVIAAVYRNFFVSDTARFSFFFVVAVVVRTRYSLLFTSMSRPRIAKLTNYNQTKPRLPLPWYAASQPQRAKISSMAKVDVLSAADRDLSHVLFRTKSGRKY